MKDKCPDDPGCGSHRSNANPKTHSVKEFSPVICHELNIVDDGSETNVAKFHWKHDVLNMGHESSTKLTAREASNLGMCDDVHKFCP